ncbi:hypothetical protein [Bacillus phage SDFMU_Pbc]|uniref:Uncharacterized protein n=1 Tax=Bacillus phage SDFMU_Pbc TaxID=3076135 RepID=A0AA96KRC1_9CAUD|nr:hypothetical protein [Bacillus phage SDFMU_Pbc]
MKNIGPLNQQPEYIMDVQGIKERVQKKENLCTTDLHQWFLYDIEFKYKTDDDDFLSELELVGHRFVITCKNCGQQRRFGLGEMDIFTSHFEVEGYNKQKEERI